MFIEVGGEVHVLRVDMRPIETVEDLALLSADDLVEAGFPRDDAAILARVVAGR